MPLASPWKPLPLVQCTESWGACLGPFSPWVLLELAEDQGYPTTNFLLSDSSGLVTCRALLWGNKCSCRQPSIFIYLYLATFILPPSFS